MKHPSTTPASRPSLSRPTTSPALWSHSRAALLAVTTVAGLLAGTASAATITWDGGGGNLNWLTPANWSGDVLPGPGDDVVIDVPGDVTITLAGNASILSLTSNEALTVNGGGTLTVAGNASNAGLITLANGRLTGGSWTAPTGLTVSGTTGNRLDGLSLTGPISITTNSWLSLRNGLTLNGTLTMNGVNPRLIVETSMTIGGNATILLDGAAFNPSRINIEGTSVLTTAPSVTIEGGWAEIGNAVSTGGISGFVNGGTLRCDTNGANFSINGEQFTNTGTVEATAGTLFVAPSASSVNDGLIRALTGGIVELSGPTLAADLGDVRNVSGTLRLKSSLDLDGGTLLFDAITGIWTLDGPVISDGTISITPGFSPTFTGSNTVFDTTTIQGPLTITNGGRLALRNGLVLNGSISMTGANPRLVIDGTQTISGNGTIHLDAAAFNPARINIEGTSILTTAPSITIEGGWGEIGNAASVGGVSGFVNGGTLRVDTVGANFSIGGEQFTNNGTIEVTAGTLLVLLTQPWTNAGTMTAFPGGTLRLEGQTNLASYAGIFNAGGSVLNATTLDLAGQTFVLSAAQGTLTFDGASFKNGALTVQPGATTDFTSANTVFDAMTINGTVTLGSGDRLTLRNGLTLNGSISMTGTNPRLVAEGTQTIGGTGTINLDGSAFNPARINIDGTSVLTTAPTITIEGGWGEIGNAVSVGGISGFVNGGVLRADTAGANFQIVGEQFTNTGTTEVTAGVLFVQPTQSIVNTGLMRALTTGDLTIDGPVTLANLGDVRNVSGVVRLRSAASLALGGSTLNLNATTGIWTLEGTTISNGSIFATPGSAPLFTGSNTAFDGVTMLSPLVVGGGQRLIIRNGLTLNSTLTLNGVNPRLIAEGTQTIGGTGTINLDGSAFNPARINIEGASVLTTAPTITIEGGWGEIGNAVFVGGNSGFVNGGLLRADTAGANFQIVGEQFTNTGTTEVTAGVLFLQTTQSIVNSGLLRALTTGDLTINGPLTLANLGDVRNVSGVVRLQGTASLALGGSTLNLNATTGIWTFDGTTISNGSISATPGSAPVFTGSNTVFDGISMLSPLVVGGGQRLIIRNGLTLNSTLTLNGVNPRLIVEGTQTIAGNGTINLDGSAFNPARINIESTSVLTTAPTITIEGGWAEIGAAVFVGGNSGFVNGGLLRADTAGANFDLNLNVGDSFTNQGTVEAINGNTLVVGTATNLSAAGVLSGGVWKANNATIRFGTIFQGTPIRELDGTEVILTGRNGKILDLGKLESIATDGILRLFDGALLTAQPAGGTLVNEGFLFVSGTSKLAVTGAFTHTATGVLTVATGAAGQIIVDASGLITLAGVAQVSNGPGYTPVAGDQVVLADGSARIGQFASLTTCEASDLFYTPTQAVYVYGEDTGIFGDLNGDGFVGPADLALLLGSWGACSDLCCQADLDLSGDVGPADIALLLGSWG
jgi:fibronectin-binding autotransporter adhesin